MCWDWLWSLPFQRFTCQSVGIGFRRRLNARYWSTIHESTCWDESSWPFRQNMCEHAGPLSTMNLKTLVNRTRINVLGRPSTVHVSTSRDRPSFVTGQQVTHQTSGKSNCVFSSGTYRRAGKNTALQVCRTMFPDHVFMWVCIPLKYRGILQKCMCWRVAAGP